MLREDNSDAPETVPETLAFFNCAYPFARSRLEFFCLCRNHMNRPIIIILKTSFNNINLNFNNTSISNDNWKDYNDNLIMNCWGQINLIFLQKQAQIDDLTEQLNSMRHTLDLMKDNEMTGLQKKLEDLTKTNQEYRDLIENVCSFILSVRTLTCLKCRGH